MSEIYDHLAISFFIILSLRSKYPHASRIYFLHLIDCKSKEVERDFLFENDKKLRDIICIIYQYIAHEIITETTSCSFSTLKTKSAFTPIKNSENENVFSIRMNQYTAEDLNRYECMQYQTKIVGKSFSNHPYVNHLNLLDYSQKSYEFVPYVAMKSENLTYPFFLAFFETEIKNAHSKLLPILLQNILSVVKLMNRDSQSTLSKRFHSLIVKCLHDKYSGNFEACTGLLKSLLKHERLVVTALEKLTSYFMQTKHTRLKWVLFLSRFLNFDLYGAWIRGNKLGSYPNCPVTTALLMGNLKMMKVLMDYNFLQHPRAAVRYSTFQRQMSHRRYIGNLKCKDTRSSEVFMFILARPELKNESVKKEKELMDKCFSLLWDTIPDPIVTKEQLLNELDTMLESEPQTPAFLTFKQKVKKVIEYYDSKWGCDSYQPRSLYHLCKCTIRRQLAARFQLPCGIDFLPIHKSYKKFLEVPGDMF